MTDELHRLGELLHVGEDLLLAHQVGPRLLTRGVDVVNTELREHQTHLGAREQFLRVIKIYKN